MFLERFKQACGFSPNLYSIDAGILYNEIDDKNQYIFKNIDINNQKYILYSKCKILENDLNSIGEYIKISPKYPKLVNELTWPGLYFTTDKYELPKYISTMFVVDAKYVIHYLNNATITDEVIIAVAKSERKGPMFSHEERVKFAKVATQHIPNVRVEGFDTLLVDLATQLNVNTIIRGLRAVSDFEFELQMGYANASINDKS